jgi:hypothetical protein
MNAHKLKTWPEYFDKVRDGIKRFEVRKNDRDFQVGDILTLEEYNPIECKFTGRWYLARVDYILQGGFGLKKGYCVMGISPANGGLKNE